MHKFNTFLKHNELQYNILPISHLSQRVRIHSFVFLYVLIVSIVFSGCQSIRVQSPLASPLLGEEILPFETMERQQPGIHSQSWTDPNPGLLVIARAEDIKNVSPYITSETKSILQQMDFAKYFALATFHGLKPTEQYNFYVQTIVRRQNQISVIAHPGQTSGADVMSSTYELIKIRKGKRWNQWIMFSLYFQNTESPVASVSHYIP